MNFSVNKEDLITSDDSFCKLIFSTQKKSFESSVKNKYASHNR